VQTLIENDEYEDGRYEIHFNGDKLSSGVYICKLSGNSFDQNRKMILLK
jgi:hypothetical protein